MTCGLCGSGITAEEKFKKQKNGNTHRHVYYGCTKVRDRNCKCGYINETDLIKEFENLIDGIDINEIGMKEKIKLEIERFKKFQKLVSGKSESIKINDVDVRNYAKFVLGEGSILEKRELLADFKGKIILNNKTISVE